MCMKIVVSGANPSLLKISNRMKKSLMSLVVIFFNLNSLTISYANGRVSVRFFTKIIQSDRRNCTHGGTILSHWGAEEEV